MTDHNILTADDYEAAKKQLAEIFNSDACATDSKSANDLMKAMDRYEIAKCKSKCIAEG